MVNWAVSQQLELNEFDVESYFSSNEPSASVEAKNHRPKLNWERNFNLFLVEAIDKGLSLGLGLPARNALYAKLAHSFGIEKNQIPEHLDRFVDIMDMIFGLSAHRLESQIIKTLKTKLGIDDNLACGELSHWTSQDSFKECVENLRQTYRKQSVD